MTEKVRFVQIDSPEPGKKDQIICVLAELLYGQRKCVLIRVEPEALLPLDLALWTFEAESFLPHGILPCGLEEHSIFLTSRPCEISGVDVLIAGTQACELEWMSQFPQVIDFAETHDEELVALSRRRFKQWKRLGVKPEFDKQFVDIEVSEALRPAAAKPPAAQKQATPPPAPGSTPPPARSSSPPPSRSSPPPASQAPSRATPPPQPPTPEPPAPEMDDFNAPPPGFLDVPPPTDEDY